MSSLPADVPKMRPPAPKSKNSQSTLAAPSRWLRMYDDFITHNAHQVSQIESALRSLTYIIPGRFRDAEIASESIHSGVQLLSLYHDAILRRALALATSSSTSTLTQLPSPHTRYTRFWTQKNTLYRRLAYLLQMVSYTELLCEMAAKRRGEKTRWRVVIILEAVKAICRLLLLRTTRGRPLVAPALPDREPIPEVEGAADEETELEALERLEAASQIEGVTNGHVLGAPTGDKEWHMPRTNMSLPTLPAPGDIGSYLLSRVLTADDIKPAPKLVNPLAGATAQAAEVLHILVPVVYALALARSRSRPQSRDSRAAAWAPWVLGVSLHLMARQLRDRSFRATPLERDEWSRRGWALGWWAMRGAFYETVTKGVVGGVRRRVPNLVGGILEDYEYLWENYYFSTSA